jgi:hypothetical protein
VTFELGRALLLSGTVTPESLSRALAASVEPGMPLGRALVGLGLVSESDLDAELARGDRTPAVEHITPRLDLLGDLPTGLCHRLAAIPVRIDPDGAVDVAVLDTRDRYVAEEMGFHLRRPVRLVRAAYPAMREALASYTAAVRSSISVPGIRPERRRAQTYTPAWGTPVLEPRPDPPALVDLPHPPPVIASVTTTTRRFFTGMHSEPLDGPADADLVPGFGGLEQALHREDDGGAHEPVFELRRGPSMTLPEIDPPTLRIRDAPAFPLVGSLPKSFPSISTEVIPLPFHDPAATLAQLRVAESRDEILALLERSARAVARRVGLLVIKKDKVSGWSCSPEFGDVAALKALHISLRSPGLLATVMAGGVYLGPLLGSIGTAFLSVMRTATRDVAMVAARVKERPTVLIVCDELGDTLLGTRHLEVMAKVAGEALERVLLARRQGDA